MAEAAVIRSLVGEVAVLTLDGSPVNAFSLQMRGALLAAIEWAQQNAHIKAVVLAGSGRGFSAGGDIREFSTAAASAAPGLSSHIHVAMEAMTKPIIACIHGFALGGGLETALACHYRIAEENALIALPEVSLGTLPLSATQRLPRLLGVLPALMFMFKGAKVAASDFIQTSLFDQVVAPGKGLEVALALASDLAAVPLRQAELQRRLVRNQPVLDSDPQQSLEQARIWLTQQSSSAAAQAVFKAVEAAVHSVTFDEGMAVSRRLYDQLMSSDEVRQQRDRFLCAPD